MLAVGCSVPVEGSHDTDPNIRVFELKTGRLLETLSGVALGLWCPGDVDGDGHRDYLGYRPATKTSRWYSGTDWAAMDRPELPGNIRLLEHDFDGDGIKECLLVPSNRISDISMCSTATGKPLVELQVGRIALYEAFKTATCIGMVADGHPAILLNLQDLAGETSQLVAFSGITGKRVHEGETLKAINGDNRWIDLALKSAPDLNHDDLVDVFSMRTPFGNEELSARSGRTLEVLWKRAGVLDDGTASLALVTRPIAADGAKSSVLAVGKVQANKMPGGYGRNGEVAFLDPATGELVKRLRETDYPEIGYKFFLDRTKSK
jgi:hypothetical protein